MIQNHTQRHFSLFPGAIPSPTAAAAAAAAPLLAVHGPHLSTAPELLPSAVPTSL
jgi:hypothetical protein